MPYKILTKERYESDDLQVVSIDDYGNEVKKSKWQVSHPKARCSSDGKEYVLSNAGDMTKEQVLEYIDNNWTKEPAE